MASAHARACALLNNSVKLHLIPSFSNCSAALIPSQVDAILIKILSWLIPCSLYSASKIFALAIVASVSKDKRASTSVEM